ncbi:MAG: acyl-CoA dehydratase activase-related protein, partial [Candidatus Hydrogenedentes bacterium]|nr:acyl-CoA dehydratase activase-related protein [Candidatus Hydrogenedentota bacterium]
MYEDWADELGLSEAESVRAVDQGLTALRRYQQARRNEARLALETVQREKRLAIVVLARPYHNDPGINQGILEQFQKRGYPILTHDALPLEDDIIQPLFGAEVAAGGISSPFSIDDVWKNTFAENSSRKLWAAKFVARHPHLVGLELSNFKCGHDAPTYAVIEEIFECSGRPFFYFKDIDENRPAGTIKLRVETIAYFLDRYRERMVAADFKMPRPTVGTPQRARYEDEEMDAELSAV